MGAGRGQGRVGSGQQNSGSGHVVLNLLIYLAIDQLNC